MDIHIPTIEQIKKALHLHEAIDTLRGELAALFGHGATTAKKYTGAKRGRKPGKKAAAAVASAAADEIGNGKRAGKKSAKKKRVMSLEAREKIAAAQRKRWAKSKRAAKKAAGTAAE